MNYFLEQLLVYYTIIYIRDFCKKKNKTLRYKNTLKLFMDNNVYLFVITTRKLLLIFVSVSVVY